MNFHFKWLIALPLMTACSASLNSQKLAYTLEENGCSTQTHEFGSQAELCASLKDDAANHYCALDLRRQKYKAECGPDFDR